MARTADPSCTPRGSCWPSCRWVRFADAHDLSDLLDETKESALQSTDGHKHTCSATVAHLHTAHAQQGRHPLMDGRTEEPFQPNDTYCDGDCASLHIITGPNMAGKSTYLKQVCIVCVCVLRGVGV